jgi:hypothetical protein
MSYQNGERTRPLAQVEIERAIITIGDEMEALTEDYARLSDEEAQAEIDFKRRFSKAIVVLAERGTMPSGSKSTADWREAKANEIADDERARFRILEARLRSTKEALITKRARLDALRTIAANVRSMGG